MSFRLEKSLPKVGIRPTIDGRRKGVRESLEDQTMKMAERVSSLIETTLRHASGEKVECVISDTCIGGVREAAKCEEKFQRQGVGLTLTVTPCWCYGTETIDMHGSRPKAIWGFNGTERPGAVYLAAAVAGHDQMGLPVFSIYGRDVQDSDDETIPEDVKEKITKFVKAGIALATFKDTSYLSVGSVSMGIAGSVVDPSFFSDYLGMRNETVDMSEITRRIEEGIYDPIEYDKALLWIKEKCQIGKDYNKEDNKFSQEKMESDWDFLAKMTLIFRDLMVGNEKLKALGFEEESQGHNAMIAGFQGQRHWTDFRPNGDFLETILNSSFDWKGIRQPFLVATENDSLNGVPMMFGHLLTGTAQIFSDVRTYWSPDAVERVSGYQLEGRAACGIIHLINSGSTALDGTGQARNNDGESVIKPFWKMDQEDVERCLDNTRFCPANSEYFRGGGFSTCFVTQADMKVTMSRVNIIKGLGPVLQIAEGYTVKLPDYVHDILNERTDPAWPTTWFVPNLTGQGAFKDVYSVMNNWGANHAAISYGHIGGQLITLASMLRIPVSMHNVDDSRIFRPKAWTAHGTKDYEGADFRACQTYGPLYKK